MILNFTEVYEKSIAAYQQSLNFGFNCKFFQLSHISKNPALDLDPDSQKSLDPDTRLDSIHHDPQHYS
jgi:hypothetical protein